MVTDQGGNIVWQWDNDDPFGNNLPNQDPNGTGNQFVFNLRMSNQYADIETGTNYNYYRDCYDPATGRYCQSDPIGLAGGSFSTYAYVNGNPLRYRDPLGLFGFPEHVSITNAALGDDTSFPGLGLNVAGVDFLPGLQDPVNSYMHAMSDGTTGQTVAQAQALYEQYVNAQIASCTQLGLARALHAVEDSAASGHSGFHPWEGGIPSLSHMWGDFFPSSAAVEEATQKAREVIARFKQQCSCHKSSTSSPAPGDPGSPGNTD
jgi:RHS repeat-associated protein